MKSTPPRPSASTASAGAASEAHAQERFAARHIGPDEREVSEMLRALGQGSLESLISAAVPASIRFAGALDLPAARSERDALAAIGAIAAENEVWRSHLGLGYSDCFTPPVILRNVLENPGWYTQYTPYQAEISQGRLEAMLVFQTMVADLTGLEIANASLLDEATAAAEAMHLLHDVHERPDARSFFVAQDCHPQTIEVVRTRARPLGVEVVTGDPDAFVPDASFFGALVQDPATDGRVRDLAGFVARARERGVRVAVACDLLAACLLRPPGGPAGTGGTGADVAIGSSQRFGLPMGAGGPHAAFMATRSAFARSMPGRLVGVSVDRHGNRALRLTLQTREQHIRREKATSNICTAQVLLAVVAGMYAVWHGPEGLRRIASRVHGLARALALGLEKAGRKPRHDLFFDTLRVDLPAGETRKVLAAAEARRRNLRRYEDGVGIALDETTTEEDVAELLAILRGARSDLVPGVEVVRALAAEAGDPDLGPLARRGAILEHPVFHEHRSEPEMTRFLHRLQARDLSLTTSMIPLGSCTMKLNASAEMLPVTWPAFGRIHPFAPAAQQEGYARVFRDLEAWLAEITGFVACSLQPNAGSQGEYAGLLAIRAFHEDRGAAARDVCLIPRSAHGTNPASAAMAGMRVVVVECDKQGNVDLADLGAKAAQHASRLAALMVTYPSTHGVFEESIREACAIVHRHGGQVYMDGANLNAQVGLCRPGDIGADVCHINLHKTFCIPHGGGGPGMGPICVARHLAPFLPSHPLLDTGGGAGTVSAAPYGSASILVIPWMYIAMMGPDGLKRASEVAILNANYVAARLREHFPLLYAGRNGLVAHECLLDVRPLKKHGIEVEDVAKRLMDYGFHAPTMSFPVPGTLMVEPTESESKAEIDRFCEAMIAIRGEARAVERGEIDARDNPLKNAPHTAAVVTASGWTHPYSRETAAFPAPWTREHKFWPSVGRVDNAYGDRNLMCSCPPVEAYS